LVSKEKEEKNREEKKGFLTVPPLYEIVISEPKPEKQPKLEMVQGNLIIYNWS